MTREDPTAALRRQQALFELARMDKSNLEQAVRRIIETDALTLGVERVSFWSLSADRKQIICNNLFVLATHSHERIGSLHANDYPKYFAALAENRIVAADDAVNDPRTSEFAEGYLAPLGIRSMLEVPVWLSGKVVGVVCHEHVGEPRHWSIIEQEFAASVADMISLALQEAETQKRASEIDFLNEQLRHRVRERSRELQTAFQLLTSRGHKTRLLGQGELIGGRARIVCPIGQGGMGVVYLGEHLPGGRRVAVKIVKPALALDDSVIQRFLSEAAAASAVSHPAIIRVLDIGVTADGNLFHIMEFVEGLTIGQVVAARAFAPSECARLVFVLAEALAAAHAAAVIHRDIKPSNLILCDAEPGLRVLDFGVSKVLASDDDLSVTRTSDVIGTPAYMAPERLHGGSAATAASDIYSVGLVLDEMMTGSVAFEGSTFDARKARVVRVGVPVELKEVISQCQAKQPLDRPTAQELAMRLGSIADRLGAPPPQEVARAILSSALARLRTTEKME